MKLKFHSFCRISYFNSHILMLHYSRISLCFLRHLYHSLWFGCCFCFLVLVLSFPQTAAFLFRICHHFSHEITICARFSSFLLSLLAIFNLKLIFQIQFAQTCECRCAPPGHFLHNTRMISFRRHLLHPSAIFFWQNMSNNTSLHICSTFLCITLGIRTHAHMYLCI